MSYETKHVAHCSLKFCWVLYSKQADGKLLVTSVR